MRTSLRGAVAALALTLALPAVAAAQPTLGFDDLAPFQPVTPLGATYAGSEFAGFFVGTDALPGTGAGATSGAQFAYVGAGIGYGEIYHPSRFGAFSGWLGVRAAGTPAAPFTVTLRGFDAIGNEVFTQALTLTGVPTYVSVDTPVIDALEFDTSALDADAAAGAVLVLDDVTISTVPEPATVALLATGLVAIGGMAHVRRRRAA